MTQPGRTVEARVLDHYPEIRRQVLESGEFSVWLQGLTALEVDGETLYLRGGDMLRDEDQVIFEWARKRGWLTEAAIDLALVAGQQHGR